MKTLQANVMTTSSRLLDISSMTADSFDENVNCCKHSVSDLPPHMYGGRALPFQVLRSG